MARAYAPLVLLATGVLAACGGGRFTTERVAASADDYAPTDRIRVMLAPTGVADQAAARAVSARVVAILQQTHGDVALIPTANDGDALSAARDAKATFLISPVIEEWKDEHAPPLTADRIEVRLNLRDANSGEVVSAVTFENVSPFLSAVDTRPDALLDQTFERAVSVLIATAPRPAAARQPGPDALEHVPVDQQKYPRQ
jgi:hypothetical protein